MTTYRQDIISNFGCVCDRFTILIHIKAAAWRFNQLDYYVLPWEAVYWSFTVPREIP